MGVVNVTPDSFSDGGRWLNPDAAVARGIALHESGADIVDIGGESTRPGATRVDENEEHRRVIPIVRALVAAGVPVSIDTMRATTAAEAITAGACLVNDVSGGLADPSMATVIADSDVPYVAMHWRGPSTSMDAFAVYTDVVADVRDELAARVGALTEAGVDPRRLIIDPGLGFAKEPEHNWPLVAAMPQFVDTGWPVLVGASRKRFLGYLLAGADGKARAMPDRDAATATVTALAALAGVWCVRVHDAKASADAVRVVAATRCLDPGLEVTHATEAP
ncbi:MAG: dihydropteroate synthase [Actinomycetota bacterium]